MNKFIIDTGVDVIAVSIPDDIVEFSVRNSIMANKLVDVLIQHNLGDIIPIDINVLAWEFVKKYKSVYKLRINMTPENFTQSIDEYMKSVIERLKKESTTCPISAHVASDTSLSLNERIKKLYAMGWSTSSIKLVLKKYEGDRKISNQRIINITKKIKNRNESSNV